MLQLPRWLQPWLLTFNALKRRERGMHVAHLNMIKNDASLHGTASAHGSDMAFATELLQVRACSYLRLDEFFGTIPDPIQMKDASDLGEQAIIDVLSMLLGAGADTISAFMQQFFKAVALHPEVSQRAQAGKRH